MPYSVNVGSITGGSQVNVIAAQCRFEFEVRVDIDHDVDTLLAPFERAVDEVRTRLASVNGGVGVTRRSGYPALRTDDSAVAFREAVRIADRGPAVCLGFGTEGGLIAAALNAPVMICGPGDIAFAHRPGEFVPIDELVRCVEFTAGLFERFCSS